MEGSENTPGRGLRRVRVRRGQERDPSPWLWFKWGLLQGWTTFTLFTGDPKTQCFSFSTRTMTAQSLSRRSHQCGTQGFDLGLEDSVWWGTHGAGGGVREDVHPGGLDSICQGAGWEIPGEYRAQPGAQFGWRVWSVKGRGGEEGKEREADTG